MRTGKEILEELAATMPTEESYQLMREYISKEGKINQKKLRNLSFKMPTEESYRKLDKFVRGLAA